MNKPVSQASVPARLLRHLSFGKLAAKRAFPPVSLNDIRANISAGEQQHRAQIRLIVEASLSLGAIWRKEGTRQRAHELFSRYRIWDTEENCGILLYINLADHKVEVVADRTSSRAITRSQWQEVIGMMTAGFARGDYPAATLLALDKLHGMLAETLPPDEDGKTGGNELSDKPVVL